MGGIDIEILDLLRRKENLSTYQIMKELGFGSWSTANIHCHKLLSIKLLKMNKTPCRRGVGKTHIWRLANSGKKYPVRIATSRIIEGYVIAKDKKDAEQKAKDIKCLIDKKVDKERVEDVLLVGEECN
ncbi:hypothetical protein DRQ25_04730 [Candidatus Fermentibacteria bacterium]|nr:MAG: hypothetical protein DRQ25_04730 [Candidatus Fermentibacteria bacterium]